MTTPTLAELTDRDREFLEAWLVAFDTAWQEDSLATWVNEKVPREHPLRRLALVEMVKVDIERQWQRGQRLTLGSYLERYPELGTFETISADLILAEYEARQQSGEPAELGEYARRFPRQADELAQLIQHAAASASVAPLSFEQPPAAERDTSRPGIKTDTAHPGPQSSRELPEVFGRYRILRKLGQGGMGTVYLALDTQLDRQVALKVPHFTPTEDREIAARFLREARTAATVQHPNLCPVYDVGQIDRIYYMTMAYIEGRLLSEYIGPGEAAPERQTAALIRTLALALQEAHARGIVHRDLKPTNIMIDQRGAPVIMDFGLARRTQYHDAALTQSGVLLGTPAYLSPEQARGKSEAVGPATDMYSLGLIMYELLTCHRPFRGEVLEILAMKSRDEEPEPPSKDRPDLDPRLEAICLKAMATRPEDRYPTMSELAVALTEYLQENSQHAPRVEQPDGIMPFPRPGTLRRGAAGKGSAARSAHPSRPQPPSQPSVDDESYGLSEAAAGLSQLLANLPSPASWPGRGEDRSYVIPMAEEGGGKPAQSLAPAAVSPGPGRMRPWVWIVAGAPGATIILGVVLFFQTNYGLVKIELSDAAANVQLRVDGDVIDITGLDRFLRLRVGTHNLVVAGEDFQTLTKSFTVKRGSEEPLRVTLVPKAPQFPADPPAPLEIAKDASQGTVTNSVGMTLIRIPPGGFMMGSRESAEELAQAYGARPERFRDEYPRHRVRLTKPFWMATCEVTVAQFQQFVTDTRHGSGLEKAHSSDDGVAEETGASKLPDTWRNPGFTQTLEHPVVKISWNDAVAFCDWLSRKEGRHYRLPTEAEWEYASRAGTDTRYWFGDDFEKLVDADNVADFSFKALFQTSTFKAISGDDGYATTAPVGRFQVNPYRLHDMHGNVSEWCADWYAKEYYEVSASEDPQGPASGDVRVVRGGSWMSFPSFARSASREWKSPFARDISIGFRVVLAMQSTDTAVPKAGRT